MADASNRIREGGIPSYWRDSEDETSASGYIAGYRAGISDARAIVADLATRHLRAAAAGRTGEERHDG